MFDTLSDKFQNLFSGLSRNKKLTEENITDAVRNVRLALLEADVNYSVAGNLVKRIKKSVIGDDVLKSVTPKQQFIKIIHDELVALMGSEEQLLDLSNKPSVVMLCGLQGSGKTTHSVKLANYLQKKNKKVLLAACDLKRPAAVEQLSKLAEKINVPVFSIKNEGNPKKVAKLALQKVKDEDFDVLIVDTAGRLHIDDDLMGELEAIKQCIEPTDVLFVANATTGQDAVKTADEFNKRISITGSILTMLDGDSRAGAAISIREITKKPLKFEGIGEKIEDLQVFNPSSMADRILGMGDVINLVRKAEENIDEEESKKLERKLKKATINYNDYLQQMKMIQKMGSVKSLMKMIPGLSSFGEMAISDKELKKTESIILSMTLKERKESSELTYPRKKRIAKGSGTSIDDVNKLVKGFKRIKQFLKKMPNMKQAGLKDMFSDMKNIKNQFGGKKLWR
jgi:signal recognition particle subunit SRP54